MRRLIALFGVPATNFYRTADLYEAILGVQLPIFEYGTEEMTCFMEEDETVDVISYTSNFDFLPPTHGVFIHFSCEDIRQTLEKVLPKEGKAVAPKTRVEAGDKGWFTVSTDSEGNRIDVHAEG